MVRRSPFVPLLAHVHRLCDAAHSRRASVASRLLTIDNTGCCRSVAYRSYSSVLLSIAYPSMFTINSTVSVCVHHRQANM